MHVHFLTFVILAVISSLIAVQLDRRFVRNRRLTQQEASSTQPPTTQPPAAEA